MKQTITAATALIVVCTIGFLSAGSGPVAAQASGEARPGNNGMRQGGVLGGGSAGHQERKNGGPQSGRAIDKTDRPLDTPQRSRGATRGYYIWLGKCWKGGGTIAMAFPPQSTLDSYFNPHWTRVSMRFCAAVRQPSSQ